MSSMKKSNNSKVLNASNASFHSEVSPDTVPKSQLTEEINRILSTTNPDAPHNLVRFNYQQKSFKPDNNAGSTQFLVCEDGAYVLKDDNTYNAFDNGQARLYNQFNYSSRGTQTFNMQAQTEKIQTIQFEQTSSKGVFSKSIAYDLYKADRKLKQQAEEIQNVQQQQPDPCKFTEHEGETEQQQEVQKDESEYTALNNLSDNDKKHIIESLNLSEKLIAESTFSEVVTDFYSWNDPADQFKPKEGNLYPLWKFASSNTTPVSQISWHPHYKSVFAVAYGIDQASISLLEKGNINIFSLNNPFYPEKQIITPSQPLCIAFNDQADNLLLAGFLDGNVAIYDLSEIPIKQMAVSSTKTGKHLAAVTSVKWRKDENKDLNIRQFISVSDDGYIINWSLQENTLTIVNKVQVIDNGQANDVGVVVKAETAGISNVQQQNQKTALQSDATILIAPKLKPEQPDDQDAAQQAPPTAVQCLKMNLEQPWLYAIGCDTGLIRVCSTDYLQNFIQSFDKTTNGHTMPISEISWNKFKPELFASASEDYLVKIWQLQKATPVFSYDLQAPVISCQFSRDVSSVLIAATSANTVHVFDFAQRKDSEICVQQVVPDDARLTRCTLNDYYPIIAVGDNKGVVRIYKLSPNLRLKSVFVPQKNKNGLVQQLTPQETAEKELEMENAKLDQYLEWCKKSNLATGTE